VLKHRKNNDSSRSRKSFDDYIHGIHVLKREWFKTLPNVTFLDTTDLDANQVYDYAIAWLKKLGVIHA